MRSLFFAWLLCFASLAVCGQKSVQRLEIETRLRSDSYTVVPVAKNGIVMFAQDRKPVLSSNTPWTFSQYDTSFNQLWEKEIEINSFSLLEGYDVDGDIVYLLFHKFSSSNYDFFKIDTKKQEVQQLSRQSLRKLTIDDFKVQNGFAFIVGESKRTPVLLHFNLNTQSEGKTKVLPTSTTKKSEFEFLDKDTSNNLMNFTFTTWKGNRCALTIQSFDPSGELLSDIGLQQQEGKNLLSGKQTITEDGNVVIIGTYGNGNTRLSDGLYITELDGEKQRYIKYYNYTDLENFLNYLPEKRREKLEKKKERKESKDKSLDLQYRLLVHRLITKNDKYMLVAEAYYPTYRYENNRFAGGFGNPYYNPYAGTQRVFDGYQYTHALLAGFDKAGNLEWDNSFELEQVKYMRLKEVVKLNVEDNQVKLLYAFRGNLLSKVVKGGKVEKSVKVQPIETDYENDKVKRSFQNDVAYWFDSYFLAWGYQRIKNTSGESEKNKRNVFFFNKVPF